MDHYPEADIESLHSTSIRDAGCSERKSVKRHRWGHEKKIAHNGKIYIIPGVAEESFEGRWSYQWRIFVEK
jgi:hypothetical protein